MNRCLLALAANAIWCSGATGQSPTIPDLISLVRETQPRGDFAVIAALESVRGAIPADKLDLWRDLLATRLTFVHDPAEALRLDCAAYATRTGRRSEPPLDGFAPRDAVTAIVELAQDRRVVMLNEEHRRSQQRAFANELLLPLFEAGFTHLALETITTDAKELEELANRRHPLSTDGFYTRDPALGDLVRRALELGMQIVGYEADSAQRPEAPDDDPLFQTNWRERRQARNLIAVLEATPNARVVVWCGRHHLSELSPEEQKGSWTPMAGIFAAECGIDPLSVDLMVMNEADIPANERRVYRDAADAGLVNRPTVFVNDDEAPYSIFEHIDVTVFLPRSRYVLGRPQWMHMGEVRQPLELDTQPEKITPTPDQPLMIEARVSGESANAIPLDRVMWRAGRAPALMLRPGLEYTIRIVRAPDQTLWQDTADWRAR